MSETNLVSFFHWFIQTNSNANRNFSVETKIYFCWISFSVVYNIDDELRINFPFLSAQCWYRRIFAILDERKLRRGERMQFTRAHTHGRSDATASTVNIKRYKSKSWKVHRYIVIRVIYSGKIYMCKYIG